MLSLIKELVGRCSLLEYLDLSNSDLDDKTVLLALGFFNLKSKNKSAQIKNKPTIILDQKQNTENVRKVLQTAKNIQYQIVPHQFSSS